MHSLRPLSQAHAPTWLICPTLSYATPSPRIARGLQSESRKTPREPVSSRRYPRPEPMLSMETVLHPPTTIMVNYGGNTYFCHNALHKNPHACKYGMWCTRANGVPCTSHANAHQVTARPLVGRFRWWMRVLGAALLSLSLLLYDALGWRGTTLLAAQCILRAHTTYPMRWHGYQPLVAERFGTPCTSDVEVRGVLILVCLSVLAPRASRVRR